MAQKDTYFKLGDNKIKIREINDTEIQLIKYFRKEVKGKKYLLIVQKKFQTLRKNLFLRIIKPYAKFIKKENYGFTKILEYTLISLRDQENFQNQRSS